MNHPEPVDPLNPEPSPDATVRLPLGAPADPYSTQKLDLSKQLAAAGTLKLPLDVPATASEQTQKIVIPRLDEPPIRRQKIDQPAEAEGQTQPMPVRPGAKPSLGWKVPAALGFVALMGVAGYLVFSKRGVAPRPLPTVVVQVPESVPPAVQVYLDKAKAGDTHAMRMLGAMYLQGLNVPKDREKGLYWYRQAAEKGSDAARSELNQIEGGR